MIEVSRAGLVTAVGNNYLQSCAAIRGGIAGFQEIPWVLADGPVVAAPARHLTGDALGASLLGRLAAAAAQDANAENELTEAPVFLAFQAPPRTASGRDLASATVAVFESLVGIECRTRTHLVNSGAVSTFTALAEARRLLVRDEAAACVIVAVDSLINGRTLKQLAMRQRLKTPSNPDGVIPGEAAACLVISRRHNRSAGLWIRGLGFGVEPALIDSGEPVLGRGLGAAMQAALQDSACTMEDVNFRMTDVSGERYGFVDANYAIGRVLHVKKPTLELLHLMDTVGSVGAAAGACQLAYLKFAYEKGCVPSGSAFCETSSDDGRRAVAVVCGSRRMES